MTEHASHEVFTRIPRWSGPLDQAEGQGTYQATVPEALVRSLDKVAIELGGKQSSLLLAAHARVIATVTGERQLLIGSVPPGGGIPRPLRLTVDNTNWRELVEHTTAEDARTRAGQAGAEVVLDLAALSEASTAPDCPTLLGDGEVVRVGYLPDAAGLRLRVLFDRTAVNQDYAERLAGYHLAALHLLTRDPDAAHHRQSLLSAPEVETLLYGLTGPRTQLPEGTFVERFEEQVRTGPDRVAITHNGTSWTYRALNARANRVAHALLAAGLCAEDVVAVVMERTPEWISTALGVLKAGGVYLPVRPDFPADRVHAQLRRSTCGFVVYEPDSEELVREAAADLASAPRLLSVPTIHADADGDERFGDPRLAIGQEQAAYIYFTSGSTGEPKGALCEHGGFLNHLFMKVEDMEMTFGADEVVTQTASQCFDISLWQFAAPLLVGGSAHIVDTDVQLDVVGFIDEIVEGRVTVAQVVPSYLEVMLTHLEQHPRPLGALRSLSVTGEALKMELVQRWFAAYPHIKLVNAYGATEVSDDTMHEVLDRVPDRDFVTVGRSLRNVNTYVLDENLALVPLGSPGEIVFSGVCVGRGYINDEERTRQAFVPDPFRPSTRMYRTGDFGRWLPEGRIEFLGRRDEQVKIRGFRIEIGEIENKLLTMAGVREAAVVIDEGTGDLRNLVAFYSSDEAQRAEELRGFLVGLLPEYMVPTYFHRLERLPLTENGKVDKKVLRRLAGTLGHGGAAYAAPSTFTEQKLAQLWAEVLGVPVERIGRNDDFFALGGTSLAAVRLLVSMDRALSLKQLVRNPRLSALAETLDGGARGDSEGAEAFELLQPLSKVPSAHRTLICFPYAGGNAVNFRSLAADLERDGIAVLGVELPGHDLTGQDEAPVDVAEVARRVHSEIQERVTTPVLLWGHCAGAAAALETARLLERSGRAPEQVFIAALLLEDTEALRGEMAEVEAADDRSLLALLRADNAYVELDGLKPERAHVVGSSFRHDVMTANRHLIDVRENPDAHRISTPVEVVVAADDPSTAGAAERYTAWKSVSDTVQLRELPWGGHYFIGSRPGEAAALVRAACDKRGLTRTEGGAK